MTSDKTKVHPTKGKEKWSRYDKINKFNLVHGCQTVLFLTTNTCYQSVEQLVADEPSVNAMCDAI